MDEQTLDRIDRYLRGEMSEKESLLFEQDALNDERLRKETELTYSIKRRLADRQQKLYQTNKWRRSKQSRFFQVGGWFAVAASLVVGLFLIMPKNTQTTDSHLLAKNDMEEMEIPIPSMENQRIARVEKTVREGRHQEALQEIEKIEAEQELPSLSEISTEKTFASYTSSEMDVDDKIQESYELNWLRICSLMQLGKMKEAKNLLADFIVIEGIHQNSADSLFKNMK